MKTKLNVYEDGEKIGEVKLDITKQKKIKRCLKEEFGYDVIRGHIEVDISGDEIYIALSELQYLWNK